MKKKAAIHGSPGGGMNPGASAEADVPPHMQLRFHALMKVAETELRKMCEDLQLPMQGTQRQIVIRLIRRLAGLPPAEADVPLFKDASGKNKEQGPQQGAEQSNIASADSDNGQSKTVDEASKTEKAEGASDGENDGERSVRSLLPGKPPETDVDMECEESVMSLLAGKQPVAEKEMESSSDSEDGAVESNRDESTIIVALPSDAAALLLAEDGHWIQHYQRMAEAAGVAVALEVSPAVSSQPSQDKDQSQQLLPGMHVVVSGLKRRKQLRLNGLSGRILRKSTEEKYWRVRFTEGTEANIRQRHISLRQVPHGEAWLRGRGDDDMSTWSTTIPAGRAEHWLCVLAAGLTCRGIAEPNLSLTDEFGLCNQSSTGCFTVAIPSIGVTSVRGLFVKPLMKEAGVVAALVGAERDCALDEGDGRETTISIEDKIPAGKVVDGLYERRIWRDAEIVDDKGLIVKVRWCFNGCVQHLARQHLRVSNTTDTTLAIYGDAKACHLAKLRTMAFVEDLVPNIFNISAWQQGSADSAGLICSHMVVPEKLTARHFKIAAHITEAVIEKVGTCVVTVTKPDSCSQVVDLLKLFENVACGLNIKDVPPSLDNICARVRVPKKAGDHVFSNLDDIEKDTFTFIAWLQPEEKAPIISDKEKLLVPGKSVLAEYEDEWHEAKVVDFDMFAGQVVVEWTFDGSESTLLSSKVKPKMKAAEKKAKQKEQWLHAPWTLAIFGQRQERKEAALRVLACSEKCCPGLWSTESIEVLDELRGDAGGNTAIAVEAKQVTGADVDPLFGGLVEKFGLGMIRRVAKAAKCYMQLMGSLFILGSAEERARSLNYLRWLLAERLERRRWDGSEDPPDDRNMSAAASALKSCRKSKAVTHVAATCDQCSWLEPAPLRDLERETQTVIVLDFGHHDADSEWDGDKPGAVHICGHDAKLRTSAAQKVEKLLEAVSTWEDPEANEDATKNEEIIKKLAAKAKLREQGAVEAEAPSTSADAPSKPAKRTGERTGNDGSTDESVKRPRKETTVSSKVVNDQRPITPSNPLAALRKLQKWPLETRDWEVVQDTVWAGHPALRSGWIRCWSRSKDSEYYYRLVDGVTTYNLADVMQH